MVPRDDARAPKDATARLQALREFAADARTVPILTQTEPDPDAIGSAFAVRVLLDRTERTAPMVSLGTSRRPETRRMLELLDLQVTEITEAELKGFERVIVVDTQPLVFAGSDVRVAVIDHHPSDRRYNVEFADVRPEFGAVSTMLTEYLRADGRDVGERLATALLFGIRTDTALLTRGCTRADVEAYAWLQERADLGLLSKIDRPAYPRDTLGTLGRALERAEVREDLVVLWLGRVRRSRAHLMPEMADLSLNIEGVRWAAAGGVVEGALVINIRYLAEDEPGAGTLARHIAQKANGTGGGHATMARVELALDGLPFELNDEPSGDAARPVAIANTKRLADWLEAELLAVREPDREKPAVSGPGTGRRPRG